MRKTVCFLTAVLMSFVLCVGVCAIQITAELSNKSITLEVEPNDTIDAIKTKIQEKSGYSPQIQQLFYNGELLEEGKTLSDYGIEDGALLQLKLIGKDFADSVGDSVDIQISASLTTTASTTVYSVDIAWGSMAFTYTAGNKGTWNPATYEYEGASEGVWSCEEGANAITVTNRSNAEVTVGLVYVKNLNYADITADFTLADGTAVNFVKLATADNRLGENGAGKATEQIVYLQISDGELTAADANVKLGSIAITLN